MHAGVEFKSCMRGMRGAPAWEGLATSSATQAERAPVKRGDTVAQLVHILCHICST